MNLQQGSREQTRCPVSVMMAIPDGVIICT